MDGSQDQVLGLVNLTQLMGGSQQAYLNRVAASVNDHVIRLSVMAEAYFWHLHPNSDETFIGVDGQLVLETANAEFILGAGDVLTVPRGTIHRTRPLGKQSVNLTVERSDMETVRI